MDFSMALLELKNGKKIARAGWNGKGQWVALVQPNAAAALVAYITTTEAPYPTLPFIALKTVNDEMVPWLPSQTDVLSGDWGVV